MRSRQRQQSFGLGAARRDVSTVDGIEQKSDRAGFAHAIVVKRLAEEFWRSMEPRASTTAGRLAVLGELRRAGIPCCVLASPMIPALNDWELEHILARAAKAGAERAGYPLLRLPLELRELFEEWLIAYYRARAHHVLSLIRNAHAEGLYRGEYGRRSAARAPMPRCCRPASTPQCRVCVLRLAPSSWIAAASGRPHRRRPDSCHCSDRRRSGSVHGLT